MSDAPSMIAIYRADKDKKIYVSTVSSGRVATGLTILYIRQAWNAKAISKEVQKINGMDESDLDLAIRELESKRRYLHSMSCCEVCGEFIGDSSHCLYCGHSF